MKKISIGKFVLSIFLFLMVFSCEKEEALLLDTNQDENNPTTLVEEVDFNSIPEISEALEGFSGKIRIASSYSEKEDTDFWIDEEDVLKLKDSIGNDSYSIVIKSNNPSTTKFYNFVVTKRVDGNPIAPFVVEYMFADGSDILTYAEDEDKRFNGSVNIYSLDAFANISGLLSKETSGVACFQDVGVKDNTVAGTNGSGSSGGTSGGSSTTGSTNTSGATVSVTRTHISVNNNFGTSNNSTTGIVYGGIGTMYMPREKDKDQNQDQKSGTLSKEEENDCPEGWVSVPINEVKEEIEPSCESFNFRNTTSLWQEAAVKGIRFKIVLISPKGAKLANAVTITQPVLFGLPSNYSIGGNLSAGSAAELSAKILSITMDQIVDRYSNTTVTDSFIAIQFRELLVKNYRDYTGGGGRVQFNYSGNLSATNYKTNLFGTGDCD
ncbi:hypothetical protein AB1A65_03955 [Muricauda sp. ANG21]|uniref:hypothetical protein n=1 Tax=Allomuricauda sp. ANG21 TaxID=3042468 RepID=UPI003456AAFE